MVGRRLLAIGLSGLLGSELVAAQVSTETATAPGHGQVTERLPPAECVRLVRSARIAEGDGDLDRALELLEEAEGRFPSEILPAQELLIFHEAHELSEERVAELRKTLSARLMDPSYPLAPGTARFLLGAMPDDQEVTQALLVGLTSRAEGDPSREDLEVLAVVQGRLGLREEARETLGRLIAIEPTYFAVSQAVRLDQERGRWQAALDLVEPLVGDARYGPALIGIYLELLGKAGRGERVLREVERLRAQALEGDMLALAMLLRQLAWDLWDAGDLERSESLWRIIHDEWPDNLEASQTLATLFSSQEERLAREAEIDRQLEEETEPGALLAQGVDYLTAGDDQRAFELLSRAIPHFEDQEAAWFNLGLAALRLEKWDETVRCFEHAVAINEQRPESYSHLGTGLRQLGRCAEAVVALEAALALDASRVVDYYYLSKCYLEIGERDKATTAMREYDRLREND